MESNKRQTHRGTLPRFRDLMHACREKTSKCFAALYRSLLDDVDAILLKIADVADTDTARNRFLEAIQEVQLRRITIEQDFYHALTDGFHNFDQGKVEATNDEQSFRRLGQLSLIDKDDFEVAVEITDIVTNAQYNFSEHLYALNHRLAIINGGRKLGDRSAALPAGPKHLCEAFLTSIDSIDLALDLKIPLLKSFQRYVVNNAGSIYDEFNSSLVRAGVLPNLTFGVPVAGGFSRPAGKDYVQPGTTQNHSAASASAISPSPGGRHAGPAWSDEQIEAGAAGYDRECQDDDALKQALFQGISLILARRKHGRRFSPGQIRPGYAGTVIQEGIHTTDFRELVRELSHLQQSSVPYAAMVEQDINAIRGSFVAQIERLSEILCRQQVNTADADVIDLVGMLFEMILDDQTLPDAVKALLSHLHTPFLKIALLDKKFFVRAQHPARRLLNAMSQAGSLCSGAEGSSLGIIAKMRDIVNRILKEFQDNTEIFTPLLDEFTAFMTAYHRRSTTMEKREVEAASGREKLQSARRTVSNEIIERLMRHSVPGIVQSLLIEAWANFLVITLLRCGEQSPEWLSALKTTDDLISSVKQDNTEEERSHWRLKLPTIVERVKAGLEIAGDIDSNLDVKLRKLEACHIEALSAPRRVDSVTREKEEKQFDDCGVPNPVTDTVDSAKKRAKQLKNMIPDEWRQMLGEDADNQATEKVVSSERRMLLESLEQLESGTWFEFYNEVNNIYRRGKLAWINRTTSKYMFVNHDGRQVVVKSLRELADDLEHGRAKLIEIESDPFVDRALKSIQELLKKEPACQLSGRSHPAF